MLYLVSAFLAAFLIIVPVYLGKIIQDRYALFTRGFVPIYAIGFFALVAFAQIIGIIIGFDTPDISGMYLISATIFIVSIGTVILFYRNWYKSEWKLNWSSMVVLIPIISVHLTVYHILPWLANNDMVTEWLPGYLDKLASLTHGTTEHFNLFLEPLSNWLNLDKQELAMYALPIPVALLFGNIMNFIVDTIFGIWNSYIFWLGTLSIIITDTMGFSLFSPEFLLLISLMFVIGIIVSHDKSSRQRSSLPMFGSVVLVASFAFTDMAASLSIVIAFGYFFYMVTMKKEFIIKHWTALTAAPMFLVSINLFWTSRPHGVTMFIALLILYTVIIMNLLRVYSNIHKAEEKIKKNGTNTIFAILAVIIFAETIVVLDDWSKFDILSFVNFGSEENSLLIANIILYIIGVVWCIWYLKFEQRKKSVQGLMLSISLVGLLLISPLMSNVSVTIIGTNLVNEVYLILAFGFIVNLLIMLNHYKRMSWIVSTFLPYLSILGIYGYIILKK